METVRPPLWITDEAGAPLLRGLHCSGCGADLFPPQEYGCIRCGAHGDRLRERDLPAVGTVLSFAEVHVHQSHPVPFTLAEIELDAGPIVRAALAPGSRPRIGQRARGLIVADEGDARLEFALAGEAQS